MLLFSDLERTGKGEWRLPTIRADKLPFWKPGSNDPPISLDKAIGIAKRWIIAKDPYSKPEVEMIYISQVGPNKRDKYHQIFYYRILFSVNPAYNHSTAIVLMDGTVLEPTWRRGDK